MSINMSPATPVPDSEMFRLSQPPLFPYYEPSLEGMKKDLEDIISEMDVLKSRVERTHALYVTYRRGTEEEFLSKKIFYDHIRRLQKTLFSLLRYVRNGHKVKYTEQRSDRNLIFSLVGHFDFEDNGLECKMEDASTVCRRFLEFHPRKRIYIPQAAIDDLLLMVRRIFGISKDMVRFHWENHLNSLVTHGPPL